MISNKTAAILFFITSNIQRAASTSPKGTKRPSPPDSSTPLVRKQRPTLKPSDVLVEKIGDVDPVEVQRGSTEETGTLQEQPASQVKSPFKTLIEKGEYEKIFGLGRDMNDEEFLEQLCPVIETLEQYNGIVDHLQSRNLVASFYVYGDIGIVKEAIIRSRGYVLDHYIEYGKLEKALPLALEKDKHERVIELLDVRKGITAEKDKQPKQEGRETSFGHFVSSFLYHLAPWENGMALRRFLILRKDELRDKHHDTLDTLCRWLVNYLSSKLRFPNAGKLLDDLIGQPSLLTPVVFERGFLQHDTGKDRSAFIKYSWRETIQEGLRTEYEDGEEELWRVIQKVKPGQFSGEFPDTEEARIAVCVHFPMKKELEERWIKNNVVVLCTKINSESISGLFPDVLWSIIFEYAVLLVVTWNLTTPTE